MARDKRLIRMTVIVLVIIVVVIPLSALAQGSLVTAKTAYSMKLRIGPGQQHLPIATIPSGRILPVEARSADSQWLLVAYQGRRGWIAGWLVTVRGDMNSLPISAEIIPAVQVTATVDVRIRSGPGTTYPILAILPYHTAAIATARNPDSSWLLVEYKGTRGWIATWLVTPQGDINTLPIASETGGGSPGAPPGTPVVTALPAPTSQPGGGSEGYTAIMRYIDGASEAIWQKGRNLGNRPNAFTKIGASDTAKVEYLRRFDDGEYDLGDYAYLQVVITTFKGSFNYVGQAMLEGMSIEVMLDPLWADPTYCKAGETPIECDYRIHKPSIAILQLLTASSNTGPGSMYYQDVKKVVQFYVDHGVIPVLTTHTRRTPPHSLAEPQNETLRAVTQEYNIPLWDLWATTETLPDYGVSDGTGHVTIPLDGRTTFFYPQYMEYGMVRRNLETLEVLHALLVQVIND